MEIKQRVIVDFTDEGIYYKFPKQENLVQTNVDESSVMNMDPGEYWEDGNWREAETMQEVLEAAGVEEA